MTSSTNTDSSASSRTENHCRCRWVFAGCSPALRCHGQGFAVTLFERDTPPPEGDADQAFFTRQRRGAAQFRHPHAFLGLMCSVLEQHY